MHAAILAIAMMSIFQAPKGIYNYDGGPTPFAFGLATPPAQWERENRYPYHHPF